MAKVWITQLNREKDNLPSKVYVCSAHFEDDCFDSSWMLRPIQRRLLPGAIPTKFPHEPVKERNFSKQEVCLSYSSETIN